MNENKEPIIDNNLLMEWNARIDGRLGFNKLFPNGAELETAMNGLIKDGHNDWAYWLFEQCRKRELYPEIVLKGFQNSGIQNSGDWNSGDRNSGIQNSGDWNSGDWNSGDWNSGYRNSGDRNSGDWNSGDRNSGIQNSGDRNSGDWNSGNQNSGFFNSNTPDLILAFNKPCDRKKWDSAYKPNFLFFNLTCWVDESNMTDEEKAIDPNFYVRGGQLRIKDYKEAFKESWDIADPIDREKVRDLPNFDVNVFYDISGIDLRGDNNDSD